MMTIKTDSMFDDLAFLSLLETNDVYFQLLQTPTQKCGPIIWVRVKTMYMII